ncbi:MAG: energy transducer TonB [Gammaproteobacteria bacterium]
MNAVVRSEALHPVREGILRSRAEAGSVAARWPDDGMLPAAAWFGKDQLKPPFWRSTGLAVFLELALLAGLFAWVMVGHLARSDTKNRITAVTLAAPPKPPRPPVRAPELPAPIPSALALAPVLPVLAPLPPIADGLPVPRALQLPAPPHSLQPSATATHLNPMAVYGAILRQQVRVALLAIARRMGLSGRDETLVEFRLKPDGKLLWARIARSSGSGTVDRAALRAFRQADFPPFIPRMVRVDTTFALWVHLNMHET